MLVNAKTELVCDLAETYHVFNMQSQPASFIAALTAGLSQESRTKRKLSGRKYSTDTLLLACILDAVNMRVWQNTKDAQKGRGRPKSVYEALTQTEETLHGFNTAEDFETYRKKLLGG